VAVISFALLLMRWIWLVLGVHGALRRAHRRARCRAPSHLLNLATTWPAFAVRSRWPPRCPCPCCCAASPSRARLLIFLATGVILFTLVMGASPAAAAAPLPPHEDTDPARGAQARAAACMAAMAS
jgi:CPA1 family monovalent cation:H+ antiporter